MSGITRVIAPLALGAALLLGGLAYAEAAPPPIGPDVIRNADVNQDGKVSFDELKAAVPFLMLETFNRLDRDHDGFITSADVPDAAQEALARLRHLLDVADLNNDHKIGFIEARAVYPDLTELQFVAMDRNHDHFLTAEDLPTPPQVPDAVKFLAKLLAEADANHDGKVSLEEAQAFVQSHPGLPQVPPQVFDFLDRNDDGFLTRADLPLPAATDPIRRLLLLLAQADANKDGEVTYEEIVAIFPEFNEDTFNALDQNDDGVLTLDDLPAGPRPFEQLLEILKEADVDHNGEVTFEEFQAVIPQLTEEQFDKLDRNGDGVISREDLPKPPPAHPYLRLLHFLDEADADNNGEVTLAEIQVIIPTFTQYAFDFLDKNDDGVLSKADVPDGPPPGPREMLVALLRMADADENGEVTFDELKALVPELDQEQFDKLDRNKDGVISRDDLPDFPCDAIERLVQILREADADGDGQVTFDELKALVPNLTQEQFDKLDRNDDGVITPADKPELPLDPIQRALRLLKEADADDNGEVTFDELKAVMPALTQELFNRLDKNDDGVITKDDLPETPLDPRERLVRLLKEADADNNGEVTFDELKAKLPNLTQEQFDKLDRNGDGVITKDDAPTDPIPPIDGWRLELLRALTRADLNHDGKLDFAEIAQAFPDAPAELLDKIDTNDDQVITRKELRAALEHAANGGLITPPADVDADGAANAVDIQQTVNDVLGIMNGLVSADVNGDNASNALDIQSVVNGVLGIN